MAVAVAEGLIRDMLAHPATYSGGTEPMPPESKRLAQLAADRKMLTGRFDTIVTACLSPIRA